MIRLLALLALAWVGGFVLFAVTLGRAPDPRPTDAVVVLTGGPGRLPRGLALLEAGRARRLLISGVDRTVRRRELVARYPAHARALRCCVDLGQEAIDTRSNGEEVARWVAARGYRSIRLVTTDWHMPRSRFELARALGPGIEIVPEPVRSEPGLSVLLREYNKYLLRRAAVLAGR